MTRYDVFNGDADGLCALHQLRLAHPANATLVTGTKRDNALLARGVRVRYVDHHEPGEIPEHPLLEALIDSDAAVCTSILVDRILDGAHRAWAVVGAFGDNLQASAQRLATAMSLPPATIERWRALGQCLNYNAYGLREEDLVYHPADLYRALAPCATPDEFIDTRPHFNALAAARTADLERARAVSPRCDTPGATLHVLPEASWAHRVFGSFANHLALEDPRRAHAVAATRPDGTLCLSLRVPASAGPSAHDLAALFGGGGRRGAAGVESLPTSRLDELIDALVSAFAAPVHG